MHDAVIEVEHLHKRYGRVTAVDQVSFIVRAGTIFTIVGPNGAGKTTTLACIEGLCAPDGGRVRVLGLDPVRDRRALYQRVGVQLQEDGLPRWIRVAEAFALYASLYRAPARPREILARCGLERRAQSFYGELSGGQKRRVLLGLALLGRPALLVLDEPTSGLDPQARFDVWQFLKEQRDLGATIILTTHAMDEAYEHSDTLCLIDRGRVLAQGAPRDLVHAHRLAVSMSGARPSNLEDLYLYLTGRGYREDVQR